jgi:hypothetical protein
VRQGGLALHYATKLRDVEANSRRAEIEKTLIEVSANRELLTALMDNDWLGLQLLVILKVYGRMGVSELSSKCEANSDLIAGTAALLVKRGAIGVEDGLLFVGTELGLNILHNLEKNSGVNLSTD